MLSSSYVPAADFTLHEAPRDFGVYLRNEHAVGNYFCTTCGIYLYVGDGENAKDGYRLNLGCVEGFAALEISTIDGKSLPVND